MLLVNFEINEKFLYSQSLLLIIVYLCYLYQ